MANKKVLITGGNGLLAVNWAVQMRDSWDVYLITRGKKVALKGIKCIPLRPYLNDISLAVDCIAPNLIVHTAGLANVDQCEEFPDLARESNVTLAGFIAEKSAKNKIKLAHISTDHYLWSGQNVFNEHAAIFPINEYGRSKSIAEKLVLDICPDALVVRTNFFGWGCGQRRSLSDWILESLRDNKELNLFDDSIVAPILATKLALAVHFLVQDGLSGIIHIGGLDQVSKFEFGVLLASRFGMAMKKIKPMKLNSSELVAPRPNNMALDSSKAVKILGGRVNLGLSFSLDELFEQDLIGVASELRSCLIC